MKEISLKLLYGMMIILLTNIITPAGKCEKQIKFLCGLIFAGMILCCVFDVLNISLPENVVYSLPAIDGEYEDSGSYKELTGYILSDYSSRLQEDIKDRVNKKLGTDCEVVVSVNTDMSHESYAEIISVTVSGITEDDFTKAEKIINTFYDVDESHIFIKEKGE